MEHLFCGLDTGILPCKPYTYLLQGKRYQVKFCLILIIMKRGVPKFYQNIDFNLNDDNFVHCTSVLM